MCNGIEHGTVGRDDDACATGTGASGIVVDGLDGLIGVFRIVVVAFVPEFHLNILRFCIRMVSALIYGLQNYG